MSTPSGAVSSSPPALSGGGLPSTSPPSGDVYLPTSIPIFSCVRSVASISVPVCSTKWSPFSNLLNIPIVSTPVPPKTGKARVHTSSECFRLLKEKEEKKIQLAYEKEKRKQEREQKKKEKEEKQKKMAAEKARKAVARTRG